MSAQESDPIDTLQPVQFGGDEDDLRLSIPLQVNSDVVKQLWGPFSRRKDESQSQAAQPVDYTPDGEPVLSEKELQNKNARFIARLIKAKFSTYNGRPACLIVIDVDFQVFLSGIQYRFIRATARLDFEDGEAIPVADRAPVINDFAPRLRQGQRSSTGMRTRTMGFEASLPGGIMGNSFGAIPRAGYMVKEKALRTGYQTIHGSKLGDSSVVWSITEDPISQSGIPKVCKMAVVARYSENRPFVTSLHISATAWSGLPVKGKTTPIIFNPAVHTSNIPQQPPHQPPPNVSSFPQGVHRESAAPTNNPLSDPISGTESNGLLTGIQQQQNVSQNPAPDELQTSLPVHIRIPQQPRPIRSLVGGYLVIEGQIFTPHHAAPLPAEIGAINASAGGDLAKMNLEEICSEIT